MQKTIYICLITLFSSLAAFAGPFDEYGYNNSSYGSPMYNTGAMGGGTFWSQLARDFYTQSNAVNPYSYSYTTETKVKTSESYIVSSTQPAESPNTIVVKYVSPSTGWDMWKIYPATTITSTQENTVNLTQANNTILTNYGPNTYYNFNVYNPEQQNYIYRTYQATSNGPVLVESATQSGPPPASVPYTAIPRSPSTGPLDTSPGSKFQIAIRLYDQQTLTLPEAYKAIVDYIDRVIPDAINGRVKFMENVISKVRAGLPPSESEQAKNLLIMYVAASVKYPTMTETQFENWFMGKPEGIDGDYDAAYWENPNLTFPHQELPTYMDYLNGMPRFADGSFMRGADNVYSLVGGAVQQARIANPIRTENTCALKVSIALNRAGVIIPYIPGKTLEGSGEFAGKYFFLNAKSLNSWMRETFDTGPENANHFSYTPSDGGPNGVNFPEKLKDKNGIYSMITTEKYTNDSGVSGHADLIFNGSSGEGTCIFGCSFNLPVQRIDIWTLN